MAQFARPDSDISQGDWTDEGSSFNDGNLYTSIREATQDGDISYVNGEGDTPSTTFEVGLTAVTDPVSSADHYLRIWMYGQGSGAAERIDVYLMENEAAPTQIAAFSNLSRDSPYGDEGRVLTSGEADAITDYSDLFVRVVNDNIGSGEFVRITQVYLEVPDPPSEYIQEYFRIRSGDDYGLNVDNGWAAAENTDAAVGTGLPFRIRFKVRETNGSGTTNSFKLQVNRNAGGWNDVDVLAGVTNRAAQAVVSGQFNDGDATNVELLSSTVGNVDGEGYEDNTGSSFTLTSEEMELEWCLLLMGFHQGFLQNVAGNTLDFRVVLSDGAVFTGSYTNPTVTVAETDGYIGGAYPETPHRLGPYIDGNGNIYAVVECVDQPTGQGDVPMMIKSTDGGRTWREMDGVNRPTSIDFEGAEVAEDGDSLMLLHNRGTTVYYHRFRMSDHATNPDTWEITDETIAGPASFTTQYGSIHKRSDTTIVGFYVDGAAPPRCRYKIRNGTWGGENTVDSEGGVDFCTPASVLAASDLIHVFYKDDTNGIIYHRTLNSSDVLSGRDIVVTGLPTGSGSDNCPMAAPVYYDDGGVEVVMLLYQKTLTNGIVYSRAYRDNVIQVEASASDNYVQADDGQSDQVQAHIAVQGKTVHLLYSQETVRDIYHSTNEDEGGWDTDVEERDAVTCNWMQSNVITHSPANGGSTVLAYLWDDGSGGGTGRIWYHELDLVTGFPPVPGRVHRDWRRPHLRM